MLIGKGTWVLVADGSKFLLFRNQGDAVDPVLVTRAHEQMSNPPTSDQGSDRPGRSFASFGAAHGAGNGKRRSSYDETDWHHQTKKRFIAHTADVLRSATEHEEGAIVVIAPAKTLGNLRKHYSASVMRWLDAEIARDCVGLATDDIVEAILDHQNWEQEAKP